MYNNLPEWIQAGIVEESQRTLKLKNGSKFSSVFGASARECRESVDLLVVDNAAFCENIADVWLALWPCVKPSGKVVFVSSLNNEGDWFHDLTSNKKFVDAHYSVLRWNLHPSRDIEWKKEFTRVIGRKSFASEFECRFV